MTQQQDAGRGEATVDHEVAEVPFVRDDDSVLVARPPKQVLVKLSSKELGGVGPVVTVRAKPVDDTGMEILVGERSHRARLPDDRVFQRDLRGRVGPRRADVVAREP